MLYVIQSGATQDLGDGYVKGSVKLSLYARSRIESGPGAKDISRQLEAAGWEGIGLTASAPVQVDGLWRTDRTIVITGHAFHHLPKITRRTSKTPAGSMVEGIYAALSHSIDRYWNEGGGHGALWELRWMTNGGKVTENEDGSLTHRLVLGAALKPRRDGDWSRCAGILDQALADLSGTFIGGLGMIRKGVLDGEPFEMKYPGVKSFATLIVDFREPDPIAVDDEDDNDEDDE